MLSSTPHFLWSVKVFFICNSPNCRQSETGFFSVHSTIYSPPERPTHSTFDPQSAISKSCLYFSIFAPAPPSPNDVQSCLVYSTVHRHWGPSRVLQTVPCAISALIEAPFCRFFCMRFRTLSSG